MASPPTMAGPKPPPPLNMPPSNHTVKVSIIDSTTIANMPMAIMVKPPVLAGFSHVNCPSYSFLLEHPSGRTLLFDLGVRKDWENEAPVVVKQIRDAKVGMEIEKDVYDMLADSGRDPDAVEAIFWSHYHWDHTGNPARFPASTALMVGPGFKTRFPPAWPTVADSWLTEDAWEGRELKEVEFSTELKIGRFKAVDWFGDGSFYVLDTPGHLLGHICGLARTTPDTFILMGGDAAHHAGEIRPTEFVPLPASVALEGVRPGAGFPVPCPGELLLRRVHPRESATKPFYEPADGFNEDGPEAERSLEGVTEFDADENVLVVLAHDASLRDVVGFYPQEANEWKRKLWRDKGRWRFLTDFGAGLRTEEDGL
ncbi:putative N-acyl homoserine lactonase AttM [Mytilinidion resinicola]|uniref:N-acyl homoserine lactonase AttM n=1 Tax=Mytilinidion resinicola TaxID=574789 RepID=A0A6A6Z3U7_9PEZI|nr:putative N-acyl homoserine lactonase AttM [Mytilinidion resinicola]KAF2815700.1 putative N-acyl homoserine lactonase AttM [Mytilinidion resinicola]